MTDIQKQLAEALEAIIELNRQHAQDQYGDADKAESWACIRIARAALASCPAPAQSVAKCEQMVRFCPGCGSVGPVDGKYRDCCPDGSRARMIPEPLARQCHDLFELAIAAHRQQEARRPLTHQQIVDIAIASGPNYDGNAVGVYQFARAIEAAHGIKGE